MPSCRWLFRLALLAAAVWLVDVMANMIGVQIIYRCLSLGHALAALGVSRAIASTPGHVGVYQWVGVSVLVPFGVARADSLVHVLIRQAVCDLPV